MNEFEVLISSYGSHKVAFLRELDKFIDNYKAKNIEYKMVNYLDSTIPGSEPFIKIFIDKVLLMRNDNCCDINSSPVKFIYDFYVLIAMKVYEANNLLALCYAMKEKLTSESSSDNGLSWSFKKWTIISCHPQVIKKFVNLNSHAFLEMRCIWEAFFIPSSIDVIFE